MVSAWLLPELLSYHQAEVIICGSSQKKGEQALKQLPEAKFYPCDTGIHQQVKDTCDLILKTWGKVDILVLNAGTEFTEKIKDITIDHWQRVMDVNLSGPFYFLKYLIGPMIDQNRGNIIITSSVVSLTGSGGGMHYSASKTGTQGHNQPD
ncbi:MAG: SDR family NAD(P)-dependent oxidoreductase [Actinomycetota bacterium]|nr:SDR family NAD(P)-dependent oxidoreductase [Actinomycetota bacterium]